VRQLGRFLRLERARKDCEHEVPLPPSRFATLEEAPVAAPTAPHASAGLERFAPEPVPPLELEPPDAEQPFVRCVRCRADSVRHAAVCRQCEARLDSEEARAFNVRLWAEMTAAREREAQELRQLEESRRGAEPGGAAEFAAREEAHRALERQAQWGSSGWLGRAIENGARVRGSFVALALGIPVVLLALSRRGTVGIGAAVVVGLAALLLLASPRVR
jgi:hypothetical protein